MPSQSSLLGAISAGSLVVFGFLLVANPCDSRAGIPPAAESRGSLFLLILGAVVIVCMAVQFYNVQQDAAESRLALAERPPRTITNAQKKLIVELLKNPVVQKGPVLIDAALEGEAWAFGDKIRDVLKEAGFTVEDVPLAISQPGQFIWVKDKKDPPKPGFHAHLAASQAHSVEDAGAFGVKLCCLMRSCRACISGMELAVICLTVFS
jgi:hypothetical protein